MWSWGVIVCYVTRRFLMGRFANLDLCLLLTKRLLFKPIEEQRSLESSHRCMYSLRLLFHGPSSFCSGHYETNIVVSAWFRLSCWRQVFVAMAFLHCTSQWSPVNQTVCVVLWHLSPWISNSLYLKQTESCQSEGFFQETWPCVFRGADTSFLKWISVESL